MDTTVILLIATRQYKQFVAPLIKQIEKYFLPTHRKYVTLFQDGMRLNSNIRLPVNHVDIEPLKFPYASLLRYKIFCEHDEHILNASNAFYIDVDMAIEGVVGDEILGDGLTATIHPGFYNGGGSWETRLESKCYVPPENRKKYYAGGFQGGNSFAFLDAIKTMAKWIEDDQANGIMPIHHDESAWNKYLSEQKNFIELDSGYCLVQQQHLREQWGISHLTPRIIALSKNHKTIRE